MSGPKKVKNWWVILRRWEKILLKRIIRRFEDFSFRMFWNSRRLLFSKTFYYGIFEDFSFRMFWNIPRLLFLHILFLFRTFLSTEQQKYCYLQPSSLHFLITTKSKQNAVSRYKHSFIDASDEFHNVRARRTVLEGSFLTSCFILSLSLSVCGFCFDLQRSAIEKWLVIDFIYISVPAGKVRVNFGTL